jgi:hypothetical protein
VRDDKPFAGPAPPAAVFFYSRDRAAAHPECHLAGYAGILQADAYAGFNRLYAADRRPSPITAASCWAHSRRKFFELADIAAKMRGALSVLAPLAAEAVKRIDAIFDIEREINGRSVEERLAVRRACKVRLRDVLKPRRTVTDYMYDFGDSWEHRLTVTGIFAGTPGVSYPRYIGGERSGPPEDCGGIPGFYEVLEALADRSHPTMPTSKNGQQITIPTRSMNSRSNTPWGASQTGAKPSRRASATKSASAQPPNPRGLRWTDTYIPTRCQKCVTNVQYRAMR